jgi:hypothetical protein
MNEGLITVDVELEDASGSIFLFGLEKYGYNK